ncbi:MAG: (2Fe-2S) ferredoxin domain-containing protein [Planctomycetes bacterium]|nr:(2Fe-2S) ferredoxin domain-containing protein [Planctomycetota bacterium]
MVARFEHHVFVCENVRPPESPRGCCSAKGSAEVRARLKDELEKRGQKGLVRANGAGCLDQCAFGVTMVVYPEQVWYGGVTVADVPEIVEALVAGKVIDRLRIPDTKLTGKAAAGGGGASGPSCGVSR